MPQLVGYNGASLALGQVFQQFQPQDHPRAIRAEEAVSRCLHDGRIHVAGHEDVVHLNGVEPRRECIDFGEQVRTFLARERAAGGLLETHPQGADDHPDQWRQGEQQYAVQQQDRRGGAEEGDPDEPPGESQHPADQQENDQVPQGGECAHLQAVKLGVGAGGGFRARYRGFEFFLFQHDAVCGSGTSQILSAATHRFPPPCKYPAGMAWLALIRIGRRQCAPP